MDRRWYMTSHPSGSRFQARKEITHARLRRGRLAAFSRKLRYGVPCLSATSWQLAREQYALSPRTLSTSGRCLMRCENSRLSCRFHRVVVNVCTTPVCTSTLMCSLMQRLVRCGGRTRRCFDVC